MLTHPAALTRTNPSWKGPIMAKRYCNPPSFPDDIDRDAFGNWLSGLVDGEGCFKLVWHRTHGKTKMFEIPGARLEISLRADDYDALEQAWAFWEVGSLIVRPRCDSSYPAARYYTSSAPDLAEVIVPHFERYPLRAKKRRDFQIWKRGVALLHQVYLRPRIGRADGIKGMYPKWTEAERGEFAALFAELQAVRVYSSPPRDPVKFTLLGEVMRKAHP